jgi:aconitate hydratase
MLGLTFADPKDYDRVSGNDVTDLLGLKDLAPGKPVTMRVRKLDGSSFEVRGAARGSGGRASRREEEERLRSVDLRTHPCHVSYPQIKLNHTFNEEQIEWFKAGSALNFMKSKLAQR